MSSYPPYFPDLAPSDYHLFPGLKKQLRVRYFSSEAEVIAAAETGFDGKPADFFLSYLQKLEQRAKKYIEPRV
jgi:histone-lysine N-methyltransferase SETMAR